MKETNYAIPVILRGFAFGWSPGCGFINLLPLVIFGTSRSPVGLFGIEILPVSTDTGKNSFPPIFRPRLYGPAKCA